MKSVLRSYLRPQYLAWFACLLCLATLSLAKALQSISVGILVAAALWQIWETRDFRPLRDNKLGWLLAGLFILVLLSYFFTENTQRWLRDAKGKVLFCIIPLSLGFFSAFPVSLYRLLWFVFSLSQSVVALISLFFYFRDFQEVNEAIGNNASIDIIGNMSHIYFGFMLAFSILLCIYLYWRFVPILGKWEKWAWAGLALVNLVCLHILTSRTGLLTFYVGLLALIVWFLLKYRKRWALWVLGAIFLVLPISSYQLIPSFRQRVDVSIWDLQQFYYDSETVAEYSLAMRLHAWKTGWALFLDHPWTGVGIADLEEEMIFSGSDLFPKEKLLDNPHNQYIENAAAYGIIGLLWLGLLLGYILRESWMNQATLAIVFITMYATGMVFESLLERQVGICLLCYFVYLLLDFHQTDCKQPT